MDTDLTPNGGPTAASRQTYLTGNASRYAAIALRNSISAIYLNNLILTQVSFNLKMVLFICAAKISFGEIASEMKRMGQMPRALYEYEAPKQPLVLAEICILPILLLLAAEVEVNTLTGEVKVLM